ncbi:hypothetical protein Q5P01_024389 [Channa striata]|uniref:Uncharacterized protein n=1 Tax=Channa striata TaxID=64152 RepID=A0AA88ILA3_CHASR|nr:hypothetical protein Q5P01_024389 [Channa striata]
MFSESSSEELESEGRHRNLKQLLKVVVNDDDLEVNQLDGSDTRVTDKKLCRAENDSKTGAVEEAACGRIASEQQVPVKVSEGVLITWKQWLQKLMRKSVQKKPRPHSLQHFMVQTKGLLRLPDSKAKDSIEEEHVLSLKRDLRACMSKRSLLTQSAVSTSLVAPKVVPVPNQVDTDMWRDQLSQRMTLSWEGEKVWREWWEDQLGLNKKDKVDALKRKRRREKEARRAAGQRVELSGSFTSSKVKQGDQQTPRSAHTLPSSQAAKHDSTPASQRRSRRPADDYLSSLFGTQDNSSHHMYFLDKESNAPPPPAASTSQLRSPQSAPVRSFRVDLSQDTSVWSGFSQSLSQSSQGRVGLSQASQSSKPKKKKSRMGF